MPNLSNTQAIDKSLLGRAACKIYGQPTSGEFAEVLSLVKAGTPKQAYRALDPKTSGLTLDERLMFALFIFHHDRALPRRERHDFWAVAEQAAVQALVILIEDNLNKATRHGFARRLRVGLMSR
jgi:hypothetical protein